MSKRTCEVCGADTSKDGGRCTNDRCGMCHTKWCTAGGNTTPGHARRWPLDHPEALKPAPTKGEETNVIAELYKHAVRNNDLETEALCQMALGLVVLGKEAKATIAKTPWATATREEAHAEVLRRIAEVH